MVIICLADLAQIMGGVSFSATSGSDVGHDKISVWIKSLIFRFGAKPGASIARLIKNLKDGLKISCSPRKAQARACYGHKTLDKYLDSKLVAYFYVANEESSN